MGVKVDPKNARGTVLIVDDEAAMRMTLQALLEPNFDLVETAGTLGEAEKAMALRRFDVVVVDYALGPDSGLTLLTRLGREESGPVGILVTAHPEHPEVRGVAQRWHDYTVVAKPYNP